MKGEEKWLHDGTGSTFNDVTHGLLEAIYFGFVFFLPKRRFMVVKKRMLL